MFEPLYQSSLKGEFFGSMCRWHMRKDRRVVIYEIVIEEDLRGMGHGRKMIERLIGLNPTAIIAQCPADLPANGFYQHLGFSIERQWKTNSGREMNEWVLQLSSIVQQGTLDLPK